MKVSVEHSFNCVKEKHANTLVGLPTYMQTDGYRSSHARTHTHARLPEARSTAVDAISSGMQAADEVARAVSRPAQDNSLIFILASRFSAGELQKTDKNSSKAADCGVETRAKRSKIFLG